MKRYSMVAIAAMLAFGLIVNGVIAQETRTKSEKTETKSSQQESDVPAALNFQMKSIDGKQVNLADYKGNVVLIVNTASRCGLTPQYKQLQALHEEYAEKGLKILGFPCNQFGKQEPGAENEIKEFCTKNYGVTFDLFAKIDVNGEKQADLYKYLNNLDLKPKGKGKIQWNFEKFVLDRNGNPIARFSPRTKPDSEEVMKVIKDALGSE